MTPSPNLEAALKAWRTLPADEREEAIRRSEYAAYGQSEVVQLLRAAVEPEVPKHRAGICAEDCGCPLPCNCGSSEPCMVYPCDCECHVNEVSP